MNTEPGEPTASAPIELELPRWQRRFFTMWGGQAISLIGSALVQFALVWWLTKTTESATVLATATLVATLPGVFVAPVAGTLVDRWNRKTIMIVADSLVALVTLVLLLQFMAGTAQVVHVYLAMFFRSAAGAFHFPAVQASTSLMVPGKQLARVSGLNQMLQGLLSIAAPPLGALAVFWLPMHAVLSIDVITACIAVGSVTLLHIPQPPRSQTHESGPRTTTIWAEFRAGLAYILGWRGLVIVIIMATLINMLLAPASSLTPLLVTKHFKGDAGSLAAMESIMGIGIVLGGLLLGVWGGFRRRILTTMAGIFGIGIGTLLIGFAPPSAIWIAMAGMFVSGVTMPLANGPLMAIFQSSIAPDMQGRAFTLINATATAAMPISLLIAGPAADLLGVQSWYILAGLTCIGMAVYARSLPSVMNIEVGRSASSQITAASEP